MIKTVGEQEEKTEEKTKNTFPLLHVCLCPPSPCMIGMFISNSGRLLSTKQFIMGEAVLTLTPTIAVVTIVTSEESYQDNQQYCDGMMVSLPKFCMRFSAILYDLY